MTALKCGEFAVGRRVRMRGEKFKGDITEINGKFAWVKWTHGNDVDGYNAPTKEHIETLKLLKLKPKAESKAPREWYGLWDVNASGHICFYPIRNAQGLIGINMQVTELRPGSAVVTREELGKAWDKEVKPVAYLNVSSTSLAFDAFCKALNLPSPEGKGGKR